MLKKWILNLLMISAALTITSCSSVVPNNSFPVPTPPTYKKATDQEKAHVSDLIKNDPVLAEYMKILRHNHAKDVDYIHQLEAVLHSLKQ